MIPDIPTITLLISTFAGGITATPFYDLETCQASGIEIHKNSKYVGRDARIINLLCVNSVTGEVTKVSTKPVMPDGRRPK